LLLQRLAAGLYNTKPLTSKLRNSSCVPAKPLERGGNHSGNNCTKHGNKWIYLDMFGNIGNIWIYLETCGYIWIYLDIFGYIVDILGYIILNNVTNFSVLRRSVRIAYRCACA